MRIWRHEDRALDQFVRSGAAFCFPQEYNVGDKWEKNHRKQPDIKQRI